MQGGEGKSLKQMSIVIELGDGSYAWYVVGGAAAADDGYEVNIAENAR
jgi:hypothetical protein